MPSQRQVEHFIDTQELTPAILEQQMQLIRLLKDADKHRVCPPLLRDASLAMIFEEPSTRTRVSFEVAMTKLGGHALYLKPGEIHLGEKENIKDTAKVLSRMCDVIEIRALKHATVTGFAEHATVPVINGLTDRNHPTQALCDVFTMGEHKLPEKSWADLTVVFVGDATNVCTSTALIVTMMGGTFIHARPQQYGIEAQWPDVIDELASNAKRYGGRYLETEEVEDAVKDADFVYTDLWWWFGQEDEIPDRVKAFKPRYQVTEKLLSRAPEHVRFMHCLPASRGVEVTDEVMDGPRSIIYPQSENRLHTEKGLLTWYVYPRLVQPVPETKAYHAAQVQAFVDDLPAKSLIPTSAGLKEITA
jgi:putrescine carbamoyltransferase